MRCCGWHSGSYNIEEDEIGGGLQLQKKVALCDLFARKKVAPDSMSNVVQNSTNV